jgi:hypothetical protein
MLKGADTIGMLTGKRSPCTYAGSGPAGDVAISIELLRIASGSHGMAVGCLV